MKEISLIELFTAIKAHIKSVVIWAVSAAVIGVIIGYSIPREYKSTVKIVPENANKQSMSSSMGALAGIMGVNVGGKAVMDGITSNLYPEIINSTPFMADLAQIEVPYQNQNITLYNYIDKEQKAAWWSWIMQIPGAVLGIFSSSEETDGESAQMNVESMINKPTKRYTQYEFSFKNRVKLTDDKKTGIIKIDVTMQNPLIAAVVGDSVVSRLQYYMKQYFTAKARRDLEVSQTLLSQAKQKYDSLDLAYANAADRNQNLISKSAQIKVDNLFNHRNLAFTIYQQLATQVEQDRIKVQDATQIATVLEPARIPLVQDSPNKKKIVMLMFAAGMFVRMLIIVIRNIFSQQRDKQTSEA